MTQREADQGPALPERISVKWDSMVGGMFAVTEIADHEQALNRPMAAALEARYTAWEARERLIAALAGALSGVNDRESNDCMGNWEEGCTCPWHAMWQAVEAALTLHREVMGAETGGEHVD